MNITVLNNVFEFIYQESLYNLCSNSSFKLGWSDGGDIETSNRVFFHSFIPEEAVLKLNIDNKIRETSLGKKLQNYTLHQGVINCSRPGESYWEHTHEDMVVVLYYPNLRWRREWGGETIFYDDNRENLIFASEYKSNRMVLFDGKIPHSVRAPSYISDQYRFTMSFFYTINKK